MAWMNFSDTGYAGKRKQTRSERFLAEMEPGGTAGGPLALIEPFYPIDRLEARAARNLMMAS